MASNEISVAEGRKLLASGKARLKNDRPRVARVGSVGEEALAEQIRLAGLPVPIREYRFAPPRLWRFDFCFVPYLLVIEVEGGVEQIGRHQRSAGFKADIEKYNRAAIMGFRLLRVTTEMVRNGEALATVEAGLAACGYSRTAPPKRGAATATARPRRQQNGR